MTYFHKEKANGYNLTCKVVGSPSMDVSWTRNNVEISKESHMQNVANGNGNAIYETQISTLISDLQVGVKLEVCCIAKDTLTSTALYQQCTTIGCGKQTQSISLYVHLSVAILSLCKPSSKHVLSAVHFIVSAE